VTHLNRRKDALSKRNMTRAPNAPALTTNVGRCALVNPNSTKKNIFSSVDSGFTSCSRAVRPSIGISCSLSKREVRWGHGDNLEHRHEYNECNRRDESSKECARENHIDEAKAKKTQDKGNQSNLKLHERIEEGLLSAYTCLHS